MGTLLRKVRWCTIGTKGLRINEKIRIGFVRLIDESNNQIGVVSINEALERSRGVELDLVEVAPMSDPPVCRIMDYGKWLYQQKRKEKEGHKKSIQHSSALKGIRLRPETDPHDLGIKIKQAREFLEKGHKVQFTVFFKGRQMLHRDRGFTVLEQITQDLGDVAKVETPSRMAGKKLTMLVVPK
ncbi:MAG: translation initiation factor IF-3 [Candidatus Brocadiia bacterium]|nr:MAG: translation initiation factor IF-3 [Candidatus Brocadiia bacterium]